MQNAAMDTHQVGGTTQVEGRETGSSEDKETPPSGGENKNKVSVPTDAQNMADPVTTQVKSSAPERSDGGATTPQDDKRSATRSTKKNKKTHQAKELRAQWPEAKYLPAKTRSQSKPLNKEGASDQY